MNATSDRFYNFRQTLEEVVRIKNGEYPVDFDHDSLTNDYKRLSVDLMKLKHMRRNSVFGLHD